MPYYISPPPQNPLTRIIAAIVAVFALVGAFIIGAAALLVVAGIGLLAGLALWARIAWVKYRLKKSGMDFGTGPLPGNQPESTSGGKSGDIIDAEYTVVSVQENQRDS
jgi:hypothetical protein